MQYSRVPFYALTKCRETFRKLDIDEWSGTAQQVRKRVKVGDPREEYRFPLPSPPAAGAAAAAAADAVL